MKLVQNHWNDHPILPYIRLCYRFHSPTFFQGPRRLLDYLVLFLEQGNYILTVEEKQYELREGDIALIQPGMLFTTHGFGDCVVPNAHLDFFFNPLRERSFVTSPGLTNLDVYSELLQPSLNSFPNIDIPVILTPDSPVEFKNTLCQMIEHFNFNNIHNTIKVQQLAMKLLLQILGDSNTTVSMDYAEQQFKSKMNAYLSFHLSTPLKVDSMARHAGYSESHFSVMFTKAFGVTPHHYLLELRLQRAKELLAASDLKLDLIAEYCGFANAAHFSKTFKLKLGCSPRSYRIERKER